MGHDFNGVFAYLWIAEHRNAYGGKQRSQSKTYTVYPLTGGKSKQCLRLAGMHNGTVITCFMRSAYSS
ncbi:hypothetical protein [Nostoc sp.]|uniref:hypothetical protein n=1 Tax=Nostoc sp. TaxID=1180 RepID=UPI002FFC8A05